MENKNEKIFPNFDPTKDLSQAGKQRRMKRGLGSKPLMQSEILEVLCPVAELIVEHIANVDED